MKSTLVRVGLTAVLIAALAGCGGGGGGGGDAAPAVPASGAVASIAASNPAANSTANNPNAAFRLVLDAGLSAVTVNSPPVINFAVIDSSGKHVPGLTLFNAAGASADPACSGANVKFAIAQLQADDTWRSLISNKQTVAASVSPALSVIYGALDPVQTATITNPTTIDATHPQLVGILSENATDGYYTYRAATDVTNPNASTTANAAVGTSVLTNGLAVVKDGKTIHRAALLLCYVDPATKATVKVNPYLDFTVGADGKAVPVKDGQGRITEAKKVVDRASCNACHQNFAAHGGARNEPQLCVMCHNPGSQDFHNNGQPVDFKLMVHKFHMGTSLTQDYTVHNSVARKTDTSVTPNVVYGVTFPGEVRNCAKCHAGPKTAGPGTAVQTAQGDNWKTKPSKNACFACHDDYKVAGSKWQVAHVGVPNIVPGQFSLTNPDSSADSVCSRCHGDGAPFIDMATAHAVPEWVMGQNYQYNIWKTTLNADRTVSVEYSVSNPTTGTDYDILDFGKYKYVIANTAGTQKTNTFVFAGTMYVGWGTDDYTNTGALGRPWSSSCTTLVASGSPTCDVNGLPQAAIPGTPNTNGAGGALIARGQPVALSVLFDPTVKRVGTSNHFTITSTSIPTAATGTGVVAFAGRVNLQKDANTSYAIPVKNVVSYFSLANGGTVLPRRDVVATAKCEVCHDKFIKNHGHGGSRNVTEVCVICHNGNNPLNGTVVVAATPPATGFVTNGVWGDSAHFKRAVHMWHKAKATDNKNTTTLLGQGINFPAQTALTAAYGDIKNCNMCHVNNSYKSDKSVIGTSRTYDVDLSKASTNATVTDTNPADNAAISPKASTCSSCHSDSTAQGHMINVGGAAFGTVTQADIAAGKVTETCNNCHASGGTAAVDTKHGLQ